MSTNLNNQQKKSLLPFILLTFLITWGIGALAIFLPVQFQVLVGELTDTSPIYFLAIAAPTLSATILTFVNDGWNGLKSLYAHLVHWQFGFKWYALILLGMPLFGWITAHITSASPLKPTNTTAELSWLLFYILVTGPLCEELGWRGYALPRLLNRFTPFTASLILGVIWGVWHLPSFYVSGMVQNNMSLVVFIIYTPCLSILMTWVFQHTQGSILSTVMIHYVVNFCAAILGVALPTLGITLLMGSILVIVFDKQIGWFQRSSSEHHLLFVGELK